MHDASNFTRRGWEDQVNEGTTCPFIHVVSAQARLKVRICTLKVRICTCKVRICTLDLRGRPGIFGCTMHPFLHGVAREQVYCYSQNSVRNSAMMLMLEALTSWLLEPPFAVPRNWPQLERGRSGFISLTSICSTPAPKRTPHPPSTGQPGISW
jgi:hypothetical protein